MDASQVTRSVQEAVTSLDRLERNAKSAGDQLDRLNRRLDETSRSVTQATMRLITFDVALGETEARLRALNTEMAVPGAVKFAKGMADAETKLSGVKQTTKDTTTEQEKLGVKTKEVGQTFERAAGETSMLEAALRTARGRVTELNTSFEKTGSEDTLKGIRAARREITALESDIKAATKDVEGAAGAAAGNAAGSAFGRAVGSVFNVSPELALGIGAAITAGAPLIGAALNGALLVGAGMGGIGLGIIGQLNSPALRTAVNEFETNLQRTLTDSTKGLAAPLASAITVIGNSLTGLLSNIDFSKIEQEIKPLADGISGLFRNLGPGLGDIFSASLPLMRQFADDLPKVGKALSDMLHQIATAPGSAEGLHVLMNMIEGAIEFVGRLLNTLGGVFVYFQGFGPTLKLAAELVSVLASAVHALADVLGNIDPNILAFGAGFLLLQGRIGKAADALIALRTVSRDAIAANAVADATGFAGALERLGASGGRAAGALAGIGSALKALTGPVGVALLAFGASIGYVTEQENKHNQSVKDLGSGLAQLAEGFQANRGEAEKSFLTMVDGNKEMRDAVDAAGKYGISVDDMAAAVGGSRPALDRFNAAMKQVNDEMFKVNAQGIRITPPDSVVKAYEAFNTLAPAIAKAAKDYQDYVRMQQLADDAQNNATQSSRDLSTAARNLGEDYKPLVNLMGILGDETQKGIGAQNALAKAIKDVDAQVVPASVQLREFGLIADGIGLGMESASAMTKDYSGVLAGIGHTASDTKSQMSTLVGVFNDIASAQINAADKAKLLDEAWQQLRGPVIGLEKSTDSYNQQLLELEGTTEKNSKGVLVYKGSLDEHSRSLGLNSLQGIHNRDTLLGLLESSYQMYLSEVRAGTSEDVAREHMRLRNEEIDRQAKKTGLNKDQTDALVRSYGTIPPSKHTEVTMTGDQAVLQKMLEMKALDIALLDPATSLAQARRQVGIGGPGGQWDGGPVEGIGGPTEDNQLTWLSVGEHIWTAAEVKAAGGHKGVETLRRKVLHGKSPAVEYPGDTSEGIAYNIQPQGKMYSIPAFALGGYVMSGSPWHTRVDVSKMPVPAAVAAPGGVPFTGPITATIASALAFLRAQSGKPYGWAQAGPGSYDCCLIGETRVYGPSGAKPIKDVRAGDQVYSYVDGKQEAHTVTAAWQSIRQPVFAVRTRNRTVTASANHPFLRMVRVGTEWARLDELNPGDLLIQPRYLAVGDEADSDLPEGAWLDSGDYTLTRVLSITPMGEADTWDLNVEGSHNFVADGVVVHNSGIVSAVWNVLHGRNPYNHTFSTSNEAGFFPIPGAGGVLTAGWANSNERGGGSVGHTAAVLAGQPFESTGSRGVHIANVTPLGNFAHMGHFDAGGYLMPGWNMSYNGTGRLEKVSPPRGQFVGHGNTSVVRHEHHVIIEGTGVLRGLRKEIRAQGGDVQGVLGS